jgi:hypothetical protein
MAIDLTDIRQRLGILGYDDSDAQLLHSLQT